jgi:hypothetical protein
LAVAIGLLAFSPVLAWNAAHGWASFAFQGGRAVGGPRLRPEVALASVLGQALYLFPWIWLPLVGVLGRGIQSWWLSRNGPGANDVTSDPEADAAQVRGVALPSPDHEIQVPAERFLVAHAVLPLGVFFGVAWFRDVLPHWSMVGYLSLMPMLGNTWVRRWVENPRKAFRRAAIMAGVPLVVAAFGILQVEAGLLQKGAPGRLGVVAPLQDPSVDLYGWDEVARELRARGLVNRPDTFLFTSKWYYSGQIAFALQGDGPVLCYSPSDPHGFAQWSRSEDWVGRDGILVVVNASTTEPAAFDRWFEAIEPLGEFAVERAGGPVRKVHLYRCVRQTKPFPLDGSRAGTARARVASRQMFGDNRQR